MKLIIKQIQFTKMDSEILSLSEHKRLFEDISKEYTFCILFNQVVNSIRRKRHLQVQEYTPGWINVDLGISLIEFHHMNWESCPEELFRQTVIEVVEGNVEIKFPYVDLPQVDLKDTAGGNAKLRSFVNYPFDFIRIDSFHNTINTLITDLFLRDYQAMTRDLTHVLILRDNGEYAGHIYLRVLGDELGVIGIRKSLFTHRQGVAKTIFEHVVKFMIESQLR